MSLIKLIEFNVLGDNRGQLTVLEGNKNIPFEIKRVYYLTGTKPGVSRGFHAHKKLEQIAVCVSGKCRMVMDDGRCKEENLLDSPSKAIRIEKMIWHEMYDFSPDCVLLVLASEHYDESDYIRDYSEFKGLIENAQNSSSC
ncbi:TDP-4-oxo-6-deoxy-alpha-D-glucose-3,4-oxoisomerase [compost metagenome]